MYPILFHIGPFPINGYGFFILLGVLIGAFLIRNEARKRGVNPDFVIDLVLYGLLAGLVGGRLFYVFTDIPGFIKEPLRIFKVWDGGLVFYGTFIAILAVMIPYFIIKQLPLFKTLDTITPALPLIHGIARIGCLMAGCCFGKQTDLPWGIKFTHPLSNVPQHLHGISLHPTQLYSSLNLLLLFFIILIIRKYKKFEGQLFWTYIILYGITRSIIELFRGDNTEDWGLAGLSSAQTISILMIIIAVTMLIHLNRKSSSISSLGR